MTGRKSVLTKAKEQKGIPLPALRDFFNPWGDWVLVSNGSMMGYFDWVPEKLRIGRWSPLAHLFLISYVATLIYTKPQPSIEFDEKAINSFPDAYSSYWYYNFFGFLWMLAVLLHTFFVDLGPFVMSSYTFQSWTSMVLRHGISALAPFLPTSHLLLQIHEILRFHCLVTATVTFTVWNVAIMPILYFKAYDTEKKKAQFLKFAFNFKMCQVHLLNILYAVLNTVTASPRKFVLTDLWCSMVSLLAYTLFYLCIMDRLGVHFYPCFSPRAPWCILTYSACVGCYFATYFGWNKFIAEVL